MGLVSDNSGMKCPKCGARMYCLDMRNRGEDTYVYRRRECRKCKHRVTTTEHYSEKALTL